jgi:hypothetical protein
LAKAAPRFQFLEHGDQPPLRRIDYARLGIDGQP